MLKYLSMSSILINTMQDKITTYRWVINPSRDSRRNYEQTELGECLLPFGARNFCLPVG
jgi:hypothetical protein